MNIRGQEFSGFRLLIDAVLVLMILVIIMGILGWVESLRFQMSEQRLYDGFDKAVNSPDGKVVLEKNLSIRGGIIFLTGSFERPGIKKKCIEFDALNVGGLVLSDTKRQVEVTNNMMVDMYYKCLRNINGTNCIVECDTCCEISFGKEFVTP
ncbi:MAG: hypothetical protein QGI60_03925 [archaeon]|jgi:hypothetical protein|nr:hypothetical protein [archaeon]